MSLLSSDIDLTLLPGRVLMRVGGRWSEHRGEAGWEGTLAALEQALHDTKPKGRARASLSHHFAQVLVAPSPPLRLGAEEMEGWIRGQLDQDYGEEAQAWRMAWQDMPPGCPVPVTVMAAGRYDELEQSLAAAGVRLSQAFPWFQAAWRRHRGRIGRGSGWLALAEPERIVVARLDRGSLTAVRTAQATDGVVASLAALLTREALHSGVEASGDLWLAAPEMELAWQGLAQAYKLHELMPGSGGWDGVRP